MPISFAAPLTLVDGTNQIILKLKNSILTLESNSGTINIPFINRKKAERAFRVITEVLKDDGWTNPATQIMLTRFKQPKSLPREEYIIARNIDLDSKD